MAILAEFTVPAELLVVGRALDDGLTAELERIVPSGESFMPYAWVFGEGFDGFESRLAAEAGVADFSRLADLGDQRLYEVTASDRRPDWVDELLDCEFTILDGSGTAERWEFHLRFRDEADARAFHQFVVDHDVPHSLDRVHRLETVYPGTDRPVTPKQREAMLLALQEGYFDCPRGTTLTELGERLDIAPSSVSARLRRGSEVLIREYLVDPGFEVE